MPSKMQLTNNNNNNTIKDAIKKIIIIKTMPSKKYAQMKIFPTYEDNGNK